MIDKTRTIFSLIIDNHIIEYIKKCTEIETLWILGTKLFCLYQNICHYIFIYNYIIAILYTIYIK